MASIEACALVLQSVLPIQLDIIERRGGVSMNGSAQTRVFAFLPPQQTSAPYGYRPLPHSGARWRALDIGALRPDIDWYDKRESGRQRDLSAPHRRHGPHRRNEPRHNNRKRWNLSVE